MTRAEYMQKLQEKLESFGKELQEEILEDYRQHFAEGQKQGRTDEEIIEELGNIEDMIQDLSEVDFTGDFGQRQPGTDTASGRNGQAAPGENRDQEADMGSKTAEAEKNFTYPGDYKEIVLEGKMVNIYVEQSRDDQIHIDYEAKGINAQLNYEFYQYEREGIFYAGVMRRKDVREDREDEEKMVKVTLFGRTIISYGNINTFSNEGQSIKLFVRVPKKVPKLTARVSAGNIHISQLDLEALESTSGSGNIKISEAKARQMKAHTGSGNIAVSGSDFQSGKFDTGSGNVKVENAKGEELKCVTGSGNVKVTDSTAREIKLSTGSGNIKASVRTAEKIKMSTGSGSIKLNLEQADGMEATIGNGSGSAHITWKGGERQKVKNGTYTYGNGACRVKAGTGSGSVDISAD